MADKFLKEFSKIVSKSDTKKILGQCSEQLPAEFSNILRSNFRQNSEKKGFEGLPRNIPNN